MDEETKTLETSQTEETEVVSKAEADLARATRLHDQGAVTGQALEAAQAAIAEQGYRTDDAHPSLFEDQGDER